MFTSTNHGHSTHAQPANISTLRSLVLGDGRIAGVNLAEGLGGSGALPPVLRRGEEGRAAKGRVDEDEGEDGDGDEDALEGDEEVLAGHDGAVPAAAELGDAEGAADEDAQGGEGEGGQEGVEAAGGAHGD